MTRRNVARSAPLAGSAAALERLDAAVRARARLLADPDTTACRLLNGAADGIEGLVIEKLGDVLIVQVHEQRLTLDEPAVRVVCLRALERSGARAAYRKLFPTERSAAQRHLQPAHSDPAPWIGAPVEPEFAILENGLRLLVRPYDGYSTGIFLEHRDNRRYVREIAAGRRVLNAFAYTCAFTVAAAVGGAAQTVSVDASRKFLEWGRRNLAANGLTPGNHAFVCADLFDYYRRAARRGQRFDCIILDPPTFARTRRPARVFSLAQDLERLVAGAVELLAADGLLLLSTNHRGTGCARLERAVAAAATGRKRRHVLVARPELPEDFRGDPDYAKSILVRIE